MSVSPSEWRKSLTPPRAALDGLVERRARLRHAPGMEVAVTHEHDPFGGDRPGRRRRDRLVGGTRDSPRHRSHSPVTEQIMALVSSASPRPRLGDGRAGEREQRVHRDARGQVLAAHVPEPVEMAREQEPFLERRQVAGARSRP